MLGRVYFSLGQARANALEEANDTIEEAQRLASDLDVPSSPVAEGIGNRLFVNLLLSNCAPEASFSVLASHVFVEGFVRALASAVLGVFEQRRHIGVTENTKASQGMDDLMVEDALQVTFNLCIAFRAHLSKVGCDLYHNPAIIRIGDCYALGPLPAWVYDRINNLYRNTREIDLGGLTQRTGSKPTQLVKERLTHIFTSRDCLGCWSGLRKALFEFLAALGNGARVALFPRCLNDNAGAKRLASGLSSLRLLSSTLFSSASLCFDLLASLQRGALTALLVVLAADPPVLLSGVRDKITTRHTSINNRLRGGTALHVDILGHI